jgi:hypothetical protein
MTNVMHKFLIYLSIYFCLICFGLSFSPFSKACVQIWQWFKSSGYGVSARALTSYNSAPTGRIFMKFHSIFHASRVLFWKLRFSLSFLSLFPLCPNSLWRSQSLSHQSKVFHERDGEQAMTEAPVSHERS